MTTDPSQLYNVAFAGHGDTGKTIFTDAILKQTGQADRIGSIEDGTTQSDYRDEEQERENSIYPGLFRISLDESVMNLLDLPGYPDFFGHTAAGVFVTDMVALFVDPAEGVMVNTRKIRDLAQKYNRSLCIVVNQLDRENVDFYDTIDQLQDAFGSEVTPLTVPDGAGEDFSTACNVLSDFDALPGGEQDRAAPLREDLREIAIESDQELMEKFFAEEEISDEEIKGGIRDSILTGDLIPVFAASGEKEIGVTPFLDFVQEIAPTADETPPPPIYREEEVEISENSDETDEESGASDEEQEVKTEIRREKVDVSPDPDGAFIGSVFRILSDPFVGMINFTRVYRGTLKADETEVESSRTGVTGTVNELYVPHGEETEEIQEAGPGEIVGITGIENAEVGDTLRKPGSQLVVEKPDLPEPMVGKAVSPKSQGAEQRLSSSLKELTTVDPSFRSEREEETNELLVYGLTGEHLQVVLDRLKREFDVAVETRPPRIPYRETITRSASAQYRHKKQSGGRGQYAEVHLEIEPLSRGEGFEFVDSIRGAAIPTKFIPSVRKGVENAMGEGIRAGYQITDVQVEVYDGDDHPVDSSEKAFKVAASQAFKEAFQNAGGTLLEPVVDMEVTVPREYMGDITGDLNSRRARIEGMDSEGSQQTVHAKVPLKEVIDYERSLRSITGGEGVYTIEPSHYQKVPSSIEEEILEKEQKRKEKAAN